MNRELADNIARATLYEGYMLYPYRPSVKNRQRWTFGGVYPAAWNESRNSFDPHTMQTQVLIAGDGNASLRVIVRFLQLVDRTVGAFAEALAELPAAEIPQHQLVESLEVAGTRYQPWQEAIERDVDAGEFEVNALGHEPVRAYFTFPAEKTNEPLKSTDGKIVGIVIRRREMIEGVIEITAARMADDLRKISVVVRNDTTLDQVDTCSRDDALMRSLVSMHVLLGATGGEFVSLTDPPDKWKATTADCQNTGIWPVLIGTGSEHDTMLASPIILYDYPQLAPESPGDLFDSTEIDEILTLRILTLTDDEKRAAADVDPRARDLLERTESLAREQLMNLHGTIRGLRPAVREQANG